MAMTKIIDPRGWDFDRPIAIEVPLSSRGLVGFDRRDFIKTAGHQFLDLIDNIKVGSGEVPVHVIALGAEEGWGSNRNGDSFTCKTCRDHHDTFVKHARWYRNHQNKNKAKSYGVIKASAFNEGMKRVELLSFLNGSKEAAERNGGLVADKELEKLARHEDLPTSMACAVPFDVCSSCRNKAATRDDYCDETTCIGPHGEKRGGCKRHLTKVGDDGHILHVDNPTPRWFDNSTVFRAADRTACGVAADYLQKAAASDHAFIPGAELAELLGVTPPVDILLGDAPSELLSPSQVERYKLAQALLATELSFESGGALALQPQTYRAFDPAVAMPLTDAQLSLFGALGSEKAAAMLDALAARKIVLPLREFARWMGKDAAAATASTNMILPGLYRHLAESGLERIAADGRFKVKTASAAQSALAGNLAANYSLDKEAVAQRVWRSAVRSETAPVLNSTYKAAKSAADESSTDTALAEAYGLYQLASLQRIAAFDPEFKLTARLVVAQNRV